MSTIDNTTTASKAWSSSSAANNYEQTRPDYNLESVKFLLEKMGGLKQHSDKFVIVELGAGTGKFTRAMLKVLEQCAIHNVKLIATEPISEMCEQFKEVVPGVEILQCPANNICLPDSSADAVIAAQCFHWFSNEESVSDIHRVLKAQGMLGIIWNMPDCTIPWIKSIEDMLCPIYIECKIPRPDISSEWLVQINKHGGFGPLNENDTSYKCTTTHLKWKGISDRYATYSVVLGAEQKERERMLKVVENTLKTIDKKDGENYIYYFNVLIKWFQKK